MFLMLADFRLSIAQERVDQSIFGTDPFLAVVSQNNGGKVPLVRYEILSRRQRAERSRDVLAFNHNKRVCRVDHVATKQSTEHPECEEIT